MRVITFPGQGTPIALDVFYTYLSQSSKQFRNIFHDARHADLLRLIEAKPSNPSSIAACSNLLYKLYREFHPRIDEMCFLGHSLGELSCLASGNRLYDVNDVVAIAGRRNELMIQATNKYIQADKDFGSRFEMWAISAPRSTNLKLELEAIFLDFPDICLANINTPKQCVITGPEKKLKELKHKLSKLVPRCRIVPLTNPAGIAFHNKCVLRQIQEPLHDFMWTKLKEQGLHVKRELDHPIISNFNGRIVYNVDEALENFVKCSSDTVQFVHCCETLDKIEVEETVHIGPGTVISGLVKKNLPNLKYKEWNSVESILS
ncbi:LAFE_0G09472g1_1 [Lachancea fermentati]|uniref:[acyl-carrier-protein] S-malonyltransferase n=1 Tax=Lachancea fermentati TaxID=4955 RepID=A0A1G4MI22_LACFM|nr:LAFE_0G09472g1_1 [Lachancea fermentati]